MGSLICKFGLFTNVEWVSSIPPLWPYLLYCWKVYCNYTIIIIIIPFMLIGSMSPWVLPERTLGTVRYTETYPGNYLICRTVPCLLSTVPWLSLFRPLLMSQYLKYTCTDRQASYLYKVGLEYETVKPRRNFNLYTLMRAILLQISRWSGMLGWKLGTVWSRLGTVRHIR